MDIVYASLCRRPSGIATEGELGEVTAALWAHASPDDGLQHVSGRCEADRLDLLLFFLSTMSGPHEAPARALLLLARCYEASAVLQRRYLCPGDTPGQGANRCDGSSA